MELEECPTLPIEYVLHAARTTDFFDVRIFCTEIAIGDIKPSTGSKPPWTNCGFTFVYTHSQLSIPLTGTCLGSALSASKHLGACFEGL